ncbi:cellulose biosynthesis protein BcsE [Aliivibrio fischeri]|uniref:Cellulose biosynthesis protein BcsE n=1 Tax=Aliivibrio fischeri TaxID=668 RepID=A0A510UCE7_ALIFS|nr:cellulose biosynthesis protein BcsE [Aliivibrio fischeri]MUK64296.1 cellulose biosynthesis protein BcsE [Aliivibrio fischeri]GEK12254.1 cellulose biosynthesis protein BcsE [Aliivibrio fischeri]
MPQSLKNTDIKEKKLSSSIYISTFSNRTLLISNVNKLIENDNQNAFVCFSPLESFIKSLENEFIYLFKSNLSKYCENIFFAKNKSITSLKSLANDIKKLQFKKNKSITITIPDNIFATSSERDVISFIKELRFLSIEKNATINLFIYGRDVHLIKKSVTQHPNLCAGYTNYQGIDKNTYLEHIYYWGLNTGMSGESETYHYLNNNAPKRYDTVQAQPPHSNLDDEDTIYISKTAIEYGYKIPDTMICAPTNSELISSLQAVSKAAIVLSCSDQSSVSQLGIQTYQLRQQHGQNVKIIIKEMKPCLRYADEMYLLQAGINLIVHFGTRFSRMQSSIEMLKGQRFTRSLPSSVEDLLSFHSETATVKGFINVLDFINYTKSFLPQLEAVQTQFALIKLECLPNINVSNYLSMCSIQREGDIMTISRNSMYLFLQGVRINDLATALHNIFKLPIQDIFLSETSFTSIGRIEHELQHIEENSIDIEDFSSYESKKVETLPTIPQSTSLAIHKPLDF